MLTRILAISMFLLAAIACPGEVSCGENPKPTDSQVKAAYIYNFAKFVEWPPGKFPDKNANIHVCVLGDDQLAHDLAAIEGKSAGDKKIGFKRSTSLENIQECEILFIGNPEKGRLDRILEAVKGSVVLTIGDTKGFAQQGVMINFYMEGNRVLFEINPRAANRAGLKISSYLLRIARIVTGP